MTTLDPVTLEFTAEYLKTLRPDFSDEEARTHASHILAAPTLSREESYRLQLASALQKELDLEASLPPLESLRHRFLRVTSTIMEVIEASGTDSSAVLSGGDDTSITPSEEALIRAWLEFEVDAPYASLPAPGTPLTPDQVAELLDSAPFYLHDRPGDVSALWSQDAAAWADSYRRCVSALATNVLHPEGMDVEDWEEFLYNEEEYLLATQEELLSRLDDSDLTLAGITALPDGTFAGLLPTDLRPE